MDTPTQLLHDGARAPAARAGASLIARKFRIAARRLLARWLRQRQAARMSAELRAARRAHAARPRIRPQRDRFGRCGDHRRRRTHARGFAPRAVPPLVLTSVSPPRKESTMNTMTMQEVGMQSPAPATAALREVHRSVQAHPLGHRPRRDPRTPVRLRPEVPARRPVARRRPHVPAAGRGALHVAGPGPDLRQHVRAGRALHRREDARGQPRPLARRPGRARGAGAPHRRGAEAPGAVPAARRDGRGGHAGRLPLRAGAERRRVGGAREVDVGGARPDARHRALLAGALPVEHRAGSRTVRAVEGRVPVPLEGRVAARDRRRARVAALRRSAHRSGARSRGRRPDRARRRRGRHRAAAGAGGRRLFPALRGPRVLGRRAGRRPRHA